MDYICDRGDIYKKYNVNEYLAEYGLCVNRDYRCRGIATEMLKARIPYMKDMGLKVTGTAFTVTGSQIAAERAGFVDYFVIR
jgi:RimJ/RimL family protein N-acetyltransferase